MISSADRLETHSSNGIKEDNTPDVTRWWSERRRKYNKGLVIAGFTAFIAYAVLGELLIAPYDRYFEITLFTTLFQGIGYLFMVLVANLFYNLGPFLDKHFNTKNSNFFRNSLFYLGFWFSVGLPFLIPAMIIVEYLLHV